MLAVFYLPILNQICQCFISVFILEEKTLQRQVTRNVQKLRNKDYKMKMSPWEETELQLTAGLQPHIHYLVINSAGRMAQNSREGGSCLFQLIKTGQNILRMCVNRIQRLICFIFEPWNMLCYANYSVKSQQPKRSLMTLKYRITLEGVGMTSTFQSLFNHIHEWKRWYRKKKKS